MSYEYSLVSEQTYKKCFETADLLVSEIAADYSISKSKVRYQQVINHIYNRFRPFETVCFCEDRSWNNLAEKERFNWLLGNLGLNVCCSDVRVEKPSFVRTVMGLTVFYEGKTILLLNSSVMNYKRLIFTLTHELVHVYKASHDNKYTQAAALIGGCELSQKAYPEELQPLEDETNVIASLLCAPSASFRNEIMNGTFDHLCNEYSISYTAVLNRLKNYFYYECGWDKYSSSQAVTAFINNDFKKIHDIRCRIGNGVKESEAYDIF